MSDCPVNLVIYETVRNPPAEAKRQFTRAGGFKGTDINTMWRIKVLTEMFGPCGFGWYQETVKKWTEQYDANHVKAFADVNLYIKIDGMWSKPISGTGGNTFIDRVFKKEYDEYRNVKKNQDGSIKGSWEIVVNDECFKMAETDAFGSACKKLGIGADVYWENDRTKYSVSSEDFTSLDSQKDVANDAEADEPADEEPRRPAKPDRFFGKPAAKPEEKVPEFTTADKVAPMSDEIPTEAELANIINVKSAMPKFKEVIKAFKLDKGAKSAYDLSFDDKVELYHLIISMEGSA